MPDAVTHPTLHELSDFGLGRLSEEESLAIVAHLDICQVCRETVEQLPNDTFIGKVHGAKPTGSTLVQGAAPIKPDGFSRSLMGKAPSLFNTPVEVPADLLSHGKYQIIRELGRGGMGVVYQAVQTMMDRPVALKVINPNVLAHPMALPRFQAEVKAAAKLDHPNIVRAYDAEQVGSLHLLVMELVEGMNLLDLVQKKGPQPIHYACHFIRQAALGLQHAFEHEMVHRDIKPHNLMVTAKGVVKILDFGLARLRDAVPAAGITAIGSFMGTPEYVSPEQATDARTADTRSDLYSLGCTLFFLLTGRPPFVEDTVVKLVLAQIEKDPPAIQELRPEILDGVAAVVAKLLEKDPVNRFQTPVELAQALAPFVKPGSKPPAASVMPPPPVAPPPEPIVREVSYFENIDAPPVSANRAIKKGRPNQKLYAGAGIAVLGFVLGTLLLAGMIFKIKVKTVDGEAFVVLEIDPQGAEVQVDGQRITVNVPGQGKPLEIKVEPGQHKLRISKDGFQAVTRDIEIKTGKSEGIKVRLEPVKVAVSQPASPAKAATDTIANGKVNLLKLIDPYRDSVQGKWILRNGILITPKGEQDRLQINYIPPSAYRLTLVVERVPGECFDFCVGIVVGGRQCMVDFDSWAHIGYRTALTELDTPDMRFNPSARSGQVLESGKKHEIACLIRPTEVSVDVNGKSIIRWHGDSKRLSLQSSNAVPNPRALFISVWNCSYNISKFELEPLSEADGELDGNNKNFEVLSKALSTSTKPVPAPSIELDAMRRNQIPREALAMAGDDDPNRAPASLVGVLGEAVPIHTDRVTNLAFSPDSRRLATSSCDKTIFLRDVTSGRVERVLRGHTNHVWSVAFSKDGQTLVSASSDGTLKLWPVLKEAEPETLQPDLGEILTTAASADGRFLAAGGTKGVIKLWKWGQWKTALVIPENGGPVTSLAFSPDGKLLASGREEKKPVVPIRLYQTSDGKPTLTLGGHQRRVHNLNFSLDGKMLASAGDDNGAKVWDLATGAPAELGNHNFGMSVAFSPDGKTVAGGFRWYVELYDLASRAKIKHSFAFTAMLYPGSTALAYSPDGKVLAMGDDTGSLFVWRTGDWDQVCYEKGHPHRVNAVAVAPDGRTVLSGGDDFTVRQWNVRHSPENQVLKPIFNRWVNRVACSPDGKTFAASSEHWGTGDIFVWDTLTLKQRFSISRSPLSLVYSPDSKTIAGCGTDGIVRLWDVSSGTEVHHFPPAGRCFGLTFSPDGQLLAAASEDKHTVTVWNVANGSEVGSWSDTAMFSAAFSPDGKLLATGHQDGTINLWSSANGDKKRALLGHTAPVLSLRFTPDGQTLVSSGDDGRIRVWNPEFPRAREIIPLGQPNRRVTFDLDPSGKYAFAICDSPLIYVLRLPQ